MIDTTLALDNLLRFRKNLLKRISKTDRDYKVIDYKIRDENYNVNF